MKIEWKPKSPSWQGGEGGDESSLATRTRTEGSSNQTSRTSSSSWTERNIRHQVEDFLTRCQALEIACTPAEYLKSLLELAQRPLTTLGLFQFGPEDVGTESGGVARQNLGELFGLTAVQPLSESQEAAFVAWAEQQFKRRSPLSVHVADERAWIAGSVMSPNGANSLIVILTPAGEANAASMLLLAVSKAWERYLLAGQGSQIQRLHVQSQCLLKCSADLVAHANIETQSVGLLNRIAGLFGMNAVAWTSVYGGRFRGVLGVSNHRELDPSSGLQTALADATRGLLQSPNIAGQWLDLDPGHSVSKAHNPSTISGTENAPPAEASDRSVDSGTQVPDPRQSAVAEAGITKHCLLAVARETASAGILAWPIRFRQEIIAYLFLCGTTPQNPELWLKSNRDMLEAFANQLAVATELGRTTWQRLCNGVRQQVRRNRLLIGLGTLALLGMAAFPVPYTMNCRCELTTTDQRFAVAPYAGTLQQIHVKPGQFVEPGTLLATMDDRDLQIELLAKQSEYERELNRVKIERAAGQLSAARIAELEAERISQEIQLIQQKRANTQIKAPIAGTIVQGELLELTGAPVEIGQNLFEVASLDHLLVEIEIPEYQYRYSSIGQDVRLYLEAFPHQIITGKVERLYPRATAREQRNVFLAEIRLDNPDHQLRPGMKGQAKVVGDNYPMAWRWFHYPYEKVRSLTGWF